jgi:hypothetical protein
MSCAVTRQTVAGPANGTLDDDSDPEFSPDLPDIERLAFVLEHHAAGSHPESLHLREAVNELLCQAIAEVLAGWVRTEIQERHDGNGRRNSRLWLRAVSPDQNGENRHY